MAPLDRSHALPGAATEPSTDDGSDLRVLTPERVALGYEIAGIGSRGAAVLVDVAAQGLLMGLLVAAVIAVVAASDLVRAGVRALGTELDSEWAGVLLLVLLLLGVFVVIWGYYLLFEIVWSGQTPGKRLLGIRVIRDNGYPVRARDSVVRNLVRMVDFLPASYVVGLLVMLLNRRAKRLGDFAAGTVVVHEGGGRLRVRGRFTVGAEEGGPARVALSAAEATLVRDFLVRRGSMDESPRAALAERLAGTLAQRYGLHGEREARGDEPFLEWLAP